MYKISFRIYLAALVVAPLAFGTVETWSLTVMESLILFAMILVFWEWFRQRQRPKLKTPGIVLLALVPAYILWQLLPLPPVFIRLISSVLFAFHQTGGGAIDPAQWWPLTALPQATLAEFFRFVAYTGVFFLTILFGSQRKRQETILFTLVFTAALIALEAIAQLTSPQGLIYWLRVTPSASSVGPYVYRNHFSGYMEMVLPLALGLFFYSTSDASTARSWREKFLDLFLQPGVNRHTLLGISATLIATAIFISRSRGGIISLSISVPIMLILLHQRRIISKRLLLAYLIPSAVLIFVGWFGWDKIAERFLEIHKDEHGFYDGRVGYWLDTLPMIKDFWITGSGAGTFEAVFPAYQSSWVPGVVVNHAHNDYVEIMATLGITGAALLSCFLGRVIFVSHALVNKRRSNFAVIIWVASLSGILALCVHAFMDFNFYNGANGLYFFTLCGLLIAGASAKPTEQWRGKGKFPEPRAISGLVSLAGIILSFVLVTAILIINLRIMAAAGIFSGIRASVLSSSLPANDLRGMDEKISQAIALDPLDFRYRYLQGNVAAFLGEDQKAADSYRQSLALNPLNSETLSRLAESTSRQAGSRDTECFLKAALQVDVANPQLYLNYADWLIVHNRRAEGLAIMRKGLVLSPGHLQQAMAMLFNRGLGAVDMLQAIPNDLNSQLALGSHLDQMGRRYGATYVYRRIEGMLSSQKVVPLNVYQQLIQHYSLVNQSNDAIKLLHQAIRDYPDESSLKLMLGDQFGKSNRAGEAEIVIREATMLNPGDLLPIIRLGAYLQRTGQTAAAVVEYDKAYGMLATTGKLDSSWVKQMSDFYLNVGNSDRALSTIRQGVSLLPGDPNLRLWEGNCLVALGRKTEAGRVYLQVLAGSPGNQEARKRLRELGLLR